MRRLSLQSESEVSLHLSLLLRLPRVGGSSESLDLGAGGEGLQEIVALRYLTKVEKTRQVELVATADGVRQVHSSLPGSRASRVSPRWGEPLRWVIPSPKAT